jgi:ubiquinone biosynthesis protein Coq4
MKTFGDLALLKIGWLKKNEEKNSLTQKCIELKKLTFSHLDIQPLAILPKNTFGYAYWEFLHRNKLSPLNFSERVSKIADRYPVSTRYTRVHDMVHTLLEFGTDFEGELGVYAFIQQQNYSILLNRAAKTARIFTRVFKPWAWKSLNKAEERGKKLSQGAKILITERLEDFLFDDLATLRKNLLPNYYP